MFVNNDLTKGFQTKSAVKKCYHNRKNTFSSTREILKKIEEQLSASLDCISLVSIFAHLPT